MCVIVYNVSHCVASCCSACLQAAVLSSAGRGRRWVMAQRKHHEAAVCTSEADRPTELSLTLSGPADRRMDRNRETWRKLFFFLNLILEACFFIWRNSAINKSNIRNRNKSMIVAAAGLWWDRPIVSFGFMMHHPIVPKQLTEINKIHFTVPFQMFNKDLFHKRTETDLESSCVDIKFKDF